MMKIGIICECGPQGAEKQVFPYMAKKLGVCHALDIVTMDSKPKLIEGCGKAAAQLLASGCSRVLIVWDLYPPWREKAIKPCRRQDREAVVASLDTAGVDRNKTKMVCIQQELESWLLCDGRALSYVLSRQTHPARIGTIKRPDSVNNPKGRLRRLFAQFGRHDYSDMVDATKIVHALPDVSILVRSSPSFARFAQSLRRNG